MFSFQKFGVSDVPITNDTLTQQKKSLIYDLNSQGRCPGFR